MLCAKKNKKNRQCDPKDNSKEDNSNHDLDTSNKVATQSVQNLDTVQGCVVDAIRRLRITVTANPSQNFYQQHRRPPRCVDRMKVTARKVALLQGRGQLKVSAYVNYGLLTVHVMQARHLGSKLNPTCDAYVKVCMMPDFAQRTVCQTEVAYDTNHPIFDEKFSFELIEGDLKKRLFISVWNKEKNGSKSEFLGCMSFGIQSIQSEKKVVNGWYYMLAEEVGRKKHLQVVTKRSSVNSRSSERLQSPADRRMSSSDRKLSSINQDIRMMDTHVVELRRGAVGGYGFSVTGGCPAQISKIEKGSSASLSGIKIKDFIVRINGQNVSRSTCESVARIIRHCQQKVVLEVQRPCPSIVKSLDNSPWRPVIRAPIDSSTPCWSQQQMSPPHHDRSEMDVTPPMLHIDDLQESPYSNPNPGLREISNNMFTRT